MRQLDSTVIRATKISPCESRGFFVPQGLSKDMTYQELYDMLLELDDSQMRDPAVVLVDDEPCKVTGLEMQEGTDGPVSDGTCYIQVV